MEYIDGIKSWLPSSQMEYGVLEQVRAVSQLPFIFKNVGVMPDAHVGIGACVGTVVATERAVVPSIVGVDIGCGVYWAQTSIMEKDLPSDLKPLREKIESKIQLGHGKGNSNISRTALNYIKSLEGLAGNRLKHYDTMGTDWRSQLGSLGGGNHFIEIVCDDDGYVGGFLHSGSRGIGNKTATGHIAIASKLMEKMFIQVPNKDLGYLVEDTEEFNKYIADMQWCQQYAYYNRCEMMDRLMEAMTEIMGEGFAVNDSVHHHHNFTNKENHFGRNIWVTRKGAVRAREGDRGLLPVAMGQPSYIVEGLGNKESFCTAPHGAGRKMARGQAKRELDYNKLVEQMDGVEWNPKESVLDEAPDAYKPANQVLENAAELIKPVGTLRPLINIKGA